MPGQNPADALKSVGPVLDALKGLGAALQQLGPTIKAATGIFDAIGKSFKLIAPEIQIVLEAVKLLAQAFKDAGPVIAQISAPFDKLMDTLATGLGAVVQLVGSALAPALAILSPLLDTASVLVQSLAVVMKAAAIPLQLVGAVIAAIGAPLKIVSAGLQALAAVLDFLSGAIANPIQGLTDLAGKIKELATAGAGLLQIPFDAISSGISSVQLHVASFIGKLNPAALIRWNAAVEDLQAAIGVSLLPIFETFIGMVREVGSAIYGLNASGDAAIQGMAGGIVVLKAIAEAAGALATILTGGLAPALAALVGGAMGLAATSGPVQEVFSRITRVIGGMVENIGVAIQRLEPAAVPLFRIMGKLVEMAASLVDYWSRLAVELSPQFSRIAAGFEMVMNSVVDALKPFVESFLGIFTAQAQGMAAAAPALLMFANAMATVVKTLGLGLKFMLGILGIPMVNLGDAKESTPQSNVGLAAKPTSTTSPESVLQKARESAFSLGYGGKKAPELQLDVMRMIDSKLGKLDVIASAVGAIKDVVVTAKKAASDVTAGVGSAVQKGADYGAFGLAGILGSKLADVSRFFHP